MSRLSEYCKKKNLREMDIEHLWIYRACLVLVPFFILVVIAFWIWGGRITNLGNVCGFRKLTGFYCIGCGGTRAFNYMVHFHFLKSLYYHPFVLYATVSYFFFIINSFLYRHNKICFSKLNPFVLAYIGLGILVVNFIVRNVLLLVGIAFIS